MYVCIYTYILLSLAKNDTALWWPSWMPPHCLKKEKGQPVLSGSTIAVGLTQLIPLLRNMQQVRQRSFSGSLQSPPAPFAIYKAARMTGSSVENLELNTALQGQSQLNGKSFKGTVTSPFHQSHLNWIHDPNPTQSRRVESKNTVPRNTMTVKSSDPIPRNPLDPIPSDSWNNSSLSAPSAPPPSNSVRSNLRCVPRNNSENKVSAIATHGSPPAPLSSVPPKKT